MEVCGRKPSLTRNASNAYSSLKTSGLEKRVGSRCRVLDDDVDDRRIRSAMLNLRRLPAAATVFVSAIEVLSVA